MMAGVPQAMDLLRMAGGPHWIWKMDLDGGRTAKQFRHSVRTPRQAMGQPCDGGPA